MRWRAAAAGFSFLIATGAMAAHPASAADCTLHILGGARNYPGEEAAWNAVFADFEKQYGCHVEPRWQGRWSDVPQALSTARLSHEPVDIVYNTGTTNATLARSGILMDITDLVKPYQDRFATGALEEYQLGGRTWAVPLSDSSTSAFFYNKTMFDQLGLRPPGTYADLVAIAKTLKDKKGVEAIVQQGKDPSYWPMWYMEAFAQTSGNKSVALTQDELEGKCGFDGKEEQAAFAALAKFAADGLLPQTTLDVDGDAMRATFLQQKAAMFYSGTWDLAALRQAKPAFEIGVFQFPNLVPGAASQHGGGPDNAWSVPSFAAKDNLPHIAQFLEFITRKAEASKILATYDPLIPSIAGVSPGGDPLSHQLTADFLPHTIEFLDWIWPAEVTDAMGQGIAGVMFGGQSPEDAAKSVQAALDTLRQERSYRFDWWSTWTDADWAKVRPAAVPTFEVKE